MAYAREAHRRPIEEQMRTPLMYMNGWEVFRAHPELWAHCLDRIDGTIDNLNASGYRDALELMGRPSGEAQIQHEISQFVKLFIAPR